MRKGVVEDELVQKIDGKIFKNQQFTILKFVINNSPKFLDRFDEVITKKLGYQKFFAQWVSKILSKNHKITNPLCFRLFFTL